MYDNYNYPAGADTPDAPWNQCDPEPKEVEVCVSYSVSRTFTISVTDYVAEHWEDCERGDEGEIIRTGGTEYDFSDCDLKSAYEEQELTLPDLLNTLKEYAQKELDEGCDFNSRKHYLERLIAACDWTEDECCVTLE